ncbi:MAG: hypothetical protein JXX29_07355 [Deltaproteobacteria bacterium]|nr:hypothetical protein [Deltaproteobacteria bacterium]MBN2671472.1 hypothetical protein [Deltaproteobacteria bacterium]
MTDPNHTPSADNNAPLHVILHIPKTSGTTVREFLKPHFQNDQMLLCYDAELYRTQAAGIAGLITEKTRVVVGHFHYGLHAHLSRPVQYHTILRDPLSRLISFYEYTKSRDVAVSKEHKLVTAAKTFSVADFFEMVPEVYNGQCLYLSPDDPGNVDAALKNLSTMHFGIQHYTAIFIEELAQTFGIRSIVFKNKKVRKTPHSIPSDALFALQKKCALDAELFERATELFLKQRNRTADQLNRLNRNIEKKTAIRSFLRGLHQ